MEAAWSWKQGGATRGEPESADGRGSEQDERAGLRGCPLPTAQKWKAQVGPHTTQYVESSRVMSVFCFVCLCVQQQQLQLRDRSVSSLAPVADGKLQLYTEHTYRLYSCTDESTVHLRP